MRCSVAGSVYKYMYAPVFVRWTRDDGALLRLTTTGSALATIETRHHMCAGPRVGRVGPLGPAAARGPARSPWIVTPTGLGPLAGGRLVR